MIEGLYVASPGSWMSDLERFSGEWEGKLGGAPISIIVNAIAATGVGVEMHQHPYGEIFLIRRGRVHFRVGDHGLEYTAGHIVVAPPNVPHAFINLGPEPLEMIDIHLAPAFATEWRDA